jgi:hypothetical protein
MSLKKSPIPNQGRHNQKHDGHKREHNPLGKRSIAAEIGASRANGRIHEMAVRLVAAVGPAIRADRRIRVPLNRFAGRFAVFSRKLLNACFA